MIQWQRAATRTLEILRKAGASQAEASKAAILIQATYRGYYTRKNLKMKMRKIAPSAFTRIVFQIVFPASCRGYATAGGREKRRDSWVGYVRGIRTDTNESK